MNCLAHMSQGGQPPGRDLLHGDQSKKPQGSTTASLRLHPLAKLATAFSVTIMRLLRGLAQMWQCSGSSRKVTSQMTADIQGWGGPETIAIDLQQKSG